jgi:hypothetical protein
MITKNQLIEAINTLKSEGENCEYDRALAELFHYFFNSNETPNPISGHAPD